MIGDILQPTHLLFVLVVALLVLGPKRLPEVGRSLGRGIRDFRSALSFDDDSSTNRPMIPQESASTPEFDLGQPVQTETPPTPAAPQAAAAADAVAAADTPVTHSPDASAATQHPDTHGAETHHADTTHAGTSHADTTHVDAPQSTPHTDVSSSTAHTSSH